MQSRQPLNLLLQQRVGVETPGRSIVNSRHDHQRVAVLHPTFELLELRSPGRHPLRQGDEQQVARWHRQK